MSKKKPNDYYKFESKSELRKDKNGAWKHKYDDGHGHLQTDTACYICYSMMTSEAYTDLTPRQQQLYTIAKMQFYGARSRPTDDYSAEDYPFLNDYGKRGCFYLNHFLLTEVFKLYTKQNCKGMYEDIEALVQHGFIERMTNKDRRKAEVNPGKRTIYRYSDAWKTWKKEG